MKLYLVNCTCVYAVEETARILFSERNPHYSADPPGSNDDPDFSVSTLYEDHAETVLTLDGKTSSVSFPYDPTQGKRGETYGIKMSFYRAALFFLTAKPLWGALSGVRPGKTAFHLAEQGHDAVADYLMREYDLSPQKAGLTADAVGHSLRVKKSLADGDYCLYFSIPFCPTRCRYCSFISRPGVKEKGLWRYIEAFHKEFASVKEELSRGRLRAFYMGGGTPAYLTAPMLDDVLTLSDALPAAEACERTVEMGRPELIDREKLLVLKKHNIRKLSVNPQSLTPAVLEACGRNHTVEDFFRAYSLAREEGFLINCDLIALLDGESPESFLAGLDRLIDLSPESISVHSLARKRAADLDKVGGQGQVADTLLEGERRLRKAGYLPYYLYRQKNTADASENVGWAKPGCASFYNIVMMEELGDVYSVGGGGVTKLFREGEMLRFSQPKDPDEYVRRWV